MSFKLIFLLIGAGLTACSSFSPHTWSSQTITVNQSAGEVTSLESEIAPYRDTLYLSMNEVIGYSDDNLVKGRPCSPLNNWAADAVLNNQDSLAQILKPNMALLNVGGLRSTINQGPITVGDIFTFMPFDNEVVWVKLPISALKNIETYLRLSGGEPIANTELKREGLTLLNKQAEINYFWVITSDYLLNGGDNMSFFEQKIEVVYTNKLLRDCFIDEVKKQSNLIIDKKCRIDVEK